MPVQSGSVNEPTVPISKTLAKNIVNKGLAEIDFPSDISGNKYQNPTYLLQNFFRGMY